MYCQLYFHLAEQLDFDNFDVLAETLDKHFPSLFNLPVLESLAKQGVKKGSYIEFFMKCVKGLEKLYTPGEIISALSNNLLTNPAIRDCFLEKLIFVPSLGEQKSSQMGFLEKMATGELKVAEPVTFLDMLRVTHNLKTKYPNIRIGVLNLASIQVEDAAKLKNNNVLMVNFNRDIKGTAKWGVVDLGQGKPRVYCETPLLEAEKRELEEKLCFQCDEVSPGKADSLASTGYTAIAWLDKNITHWWNFDIAADFNALFFDYIMAQFRGDADGLSFEVNENEYRDYVSPALHHILQTHNSLSSHPGYVYGRINGFPLIKLASFSMLGELKGEELPLNDLAKTIAIVGQKHFSKNDFRDVIAASYRSNIQRFAHTLKSGHSPFLKENEDEVTLTVPRYFNVNQLLQNHINSCAQTSTNPELFKYIRRKQSINNASYEAEDVATAMVLTLFRARAKYPKITVSLPDCYQLKKDEQQFIIELMQDNAYVTEFIINENNVSLQQVKADLLPVFARNRWLAENGYRPPMVDNYWHRAAKYWLIHLSQQTNLLTDKHEHDVFKRCVQEMGVKGLQALLHLLNDEAQRDFVEGIYGKIKPAFFAACQPGEVNEYLTMLLEHVQKKAPFPFSELGIAYQPLHNSRYVELINHINLSGQFEQLVLTECLKNAAAFHEFLMLLTQTAHERKWVGLIVIPELENKEAVSEIHRQLRGFYDNLNNVILRNRHQRLAEPLVQKIMAVSQFTEASPDKNPQSRIRANTLEMTSIGDVFATMDANKTWPLKRGVVHLELQQQQEIAQTRQLQQNQEKILMQALEEAIAAERVTYDNIDRLLGKFHSKFMEENPVDERNAPLRVHGETLLQGLFHTWINATPNVSAPYVIHSITQDAAKMLIKKQGRFTSGLSLDNLPKGFYTQRAKDGSLILSYNPEVGYVNGYNPFTVNLQVKTPKAEAWEGDFRLLDDNSVQWRPLANKDFSLLVLFAKLQPAQQFDDELTAFLKANPLLRDKILPQHTRVLNHWLVFLQAWKYEGGNGIDKFFAMDEASLSLTSDKTAALFFRNQSVPLQAWIANTHFTDEQLRALGQVYYRYGNEVMTLLLRKFHQIDQALGQDFFKEFKATVLSSSANYNCFINESFFEAMDDMIATLRLQKAAGSRQAWLAICQKHLQIVRWEPVEILWRSFEYFIAEITELGLELVGDEFDGVAPENMQVCMDRMLATLRHIPAQEEKVRFLRRFSTQQLTHGGVHYAIQYEGFNYFEDELALHDFELGKPTYAPNLREIYQWNEESALLNIRRTLASRSQFSHDDYHYLANQWEHADKAVKNQLIFLLFTHYDARNVPVELAKITNLPFPLVDLLAEALHRAVFQHNNQSLHVSLDAMVALCTALQNRNELQQPVVHLLQRYPEGTFLEALSILWQTKRWAELEQVIALFSAPLPKPADAPEYLFRDGYKLAVLFATNDIKPFSNRIAHLSPVVRNELRLLINQLLSINYETSALAELSNPDNWSDLLAAINAMEYDRAHTATHRIAFIEKLKAKGIQFNYSTSGEFRTLKDTLDDRPESLGFFVDHQARLWKFFMEHLAVPSKGNAKEALQPIMQFFKRLQLNRTYLNEIEPLLATLEKTPKGQVWTANYFYQMLKALQPEDQQASFPISLVKVVLNDNTLCAKPIDSVERDFPASLVSPLQAILKNTVFTKAQQSILCELALNEFGWQKNHTMLSDIIDLLTPDMRAATREYALEIFAKSKNIPELESRIDKTRWLLEQASDEMAVQTNWTLTTALWLKAIAASPGEDALFARIRNDDTIDAAKKTLLLHIIAWSSLHAGLRNSQTHHHELAHKTPKLVKQLTAMSNADLLLLAACYPRQPSPSADDIIRLLKKQSKSGLAWAACLEDYSRTPHLEPRMDYKEVAKTREADLQRMLRETRVTRGEEKIPLDTEQMARVALVFAELKQLQKGSVFISGFNKAVDAMTQEELLQAYRVLSEQTGKEPDNDRLQAHLWAVLFQGLSHTTRKYPHLAQQFALIVNDISVDSLTRVLKLSTGEGKSHFVALRALKHVGREREVDICTAKRTLAERDLADYEEFFGFFGVKSSYIHPLSLRETYTQAQIRYSTTGDLSLFLDAQSFNGHPIPIDLKKRVALFDEYDFIRFEEGRKTEYNYARPTGRTPKQLTWFYQAINRFYLENKALLVQKGLITKDTLIAAATMLQKTAGDDEEKQQLVNALLSEPLCLVRWLQSAYDAHEQQLGFGFTVREEMITVGDTSYPMREIIPLSSDNQKMVGSTFSAGVQQLLAVRLNTEARLKNEPQNYHIHAESNIISSQVASQRMKQLWGEWEGFSGSISASQANTLYDQQETQVLHVSTNQMDLRAWHAPQFYQKDSARLQALVNQIRVCLAQKQSMLFSCKNDAQVLELKKQLKDLLTDDELANFLFYTNEDEMSANDILAKKQTLEGWQGGKKQQAIGLIASGFGRGDNVGVEAVFLFDVNDINDLLQKGGRTARNGEEGEVFQFYLTPQLVAEEGRLRQVMAQSKDVDVKAIDELLAKVEGQNDNEKCFSRVMLLREYIFSLQNVANQGYHEGLAQFSTWGMDFIRHFSDPALVNEFVLSLTSAIKNLDKQWTHISSDPGRSANEKIQAIEACLRDEAGRLHDVGKDVLKGSAGEVIPLTLQPYLETKVRMVLESTQPTSRLTHEMAVICTVFARLSMNSSDLIHAAQLPKWLQVLATDEQVMNAFSRQIVGCESVSSFISQLAVCVEKIEKPSSALQALQASIVREKTPQELLDGVAPPLSTLLLDGLQQLNTALADAIIVNLGKPSTLSNAGRVEAVLPLVQYLARFTEKQQLQWGMDYALNLHKIIHADGLEVKAMLSKKAMSYRHINSLWQLARAHASEETALPLFTLLQKAINDAPEHRLRQFTRVETLVAYLDKNDARAFLADVATVMTQFTEGKDWDSFVKLLERTQSLWNKDGSGDNRKELQQLWHRLAERAPQLPQLTRSLAQSFELSGKAWIAFLSPFLTFSPERLVAEQQTLQTILRRIATLEISKEDKKQLVVQIINGLGKHTQPVSVDYIFDLINNLPELGLLEEALGVVMALPPVSDIAQVNVATNESVTKEVINLFQQHGFYQRMSVMERAECIRAMNDVIFLWHGETEARVQEKVAQLLGNYEGFLERLNLEVTHYPEGLSFASGALWYFHFIQSYPSLADELTTVITTVPNLRIATLKEEFAAHSFKAEEGRQLLNWAVTQKLTDKAFSGSCQQLAGFNALLGQIPSFSIKERALLQEKLQALPPANLEIICPQLANYQAEIRANPSLLAMILDYSQGFTTDGRLLPLTTLLLQTVGQNHYGEERLNYLKEAMDIFLEKITLEPLFSDYCQKMINFEQLVQGLNLGEDSKAKLQRQLLDLPMHKVNLILTSVTAYREEMLANPEVPGILIYYGLSEAIDLSQLTLITTVLFDTLGLKMRTPAETNAIVAGIDKLLQNPEPQAFEIHYPALINAHGLIAAMSHLSDAEKELMHTHLQYLPDDKYTMMLSLLSTHRQQLAGNSRLLNMLLNYGLEPAISPVMMDLLSSLLLKVTANNPQHLEHFKAGVDRFIDAEPEILRQLSKLVERNPARIEELLFDNVAFYLQNYVYEGERNKVKGIVDFFYERAAKERGMPKLMFDKDDKRFNDLFDFTNQNEEHRDQRVIWMHLLNHQAFVTSEERNGEHDNHIYQWDKAQNTALIGLGFDRYVAYFEQVLKEAPAKNVHLNRDLSGSQQNQLLALSHELSLIANPVLDLNSRTSTTIVKKMGSGLGQLLTNYQSSWFKTIERKNQLQNLTTAVNRALSGEDGSDCYQQVIAAINNVRKTAMESDERNSQTRFLKLNRGGSSRLYNTLNQMEDLVLRHWAVDPLALQAFQAYQDTARGEFFEVLGALYDSMNFNELENERSFTTLYGMKKLTHFFTTNATLQVQSALHLAMQQFRNKKNPCKADYEQFLQHLQKDSPMLPGHVQALVKEVLNRGKAFAIHLERQETHSAQTILRQ